MCGIAGLITQTKDKSSLQAQGEAMLSALQHRGPDSHGLWIDADRNILLAHTRLAIQDLSEHGRQPMWSHSGRYCIVFNGEIYNFRELTNELKKFGYTFSGHSDTEVLLCAIEQWGLETAIRKSTGMFALGLWDKKERTLALSRDRLGEKPLYYGWVDNKFIFSSELKAIEAIIKKEHLRMDDLGIYSYIRYGYVSAPQSIYKNIYKLIPGTTIIFHSDNIFNTNNFSPYAGKERLSPTEYWSVDEAAADGLSNQIRDERQAEEELESLLKKTIEKQIIADVGIGVFLSGGIDSSIVSAIAQTLSTDPIKTYSIGFTEKEYDESTFAKEIAAHIGSNHSTINASPADTLNLVPDLPYIFDEPFSDSSQIPMHIVSKYARKEVTVCLSGDGGDELFAGYNRYISTDELWRKVAKIPINMRKIIASLLDVPRPAFWDCVYQGIHALKRGEQEKQKLVGLKVQKLAGLLKQPDIISGYNYLLSYWNNPEDIIHFHSGFSRPKAPGTGNLGINEFINTAMFIDQKNYLPGDNLTKVDRATMAVSLESRLPLLSHELVELSWKIPVSMKVKEQTSKWLLRKVLYKYVPQNLIDRPKMGFSVPVGDWLRKDLREWTEDLLSLAGTNGYEIFNTQKINSTWESHKAGKQDHSQRLWTVLMLLSWMHARSY